MSSVHPAATIADRRLAVFRLALSLLLAGVGSALVVLAFSPFSAATAAFSAPLYAVVAGGYSLFPFLARQLLGVRWAATGTGAIAGVLSAPISPIGLLIVVPFVGAGAAFDATVWALGRSAGLRRRPEGVFLVAALISALVLFLVSLPVINPVDRGTPVFLLAVLGGRVVGQVAATLAAAGIVRAARRFGSPRG